MKHLIKKEFVIGMHPATYIFMLFGPMLLIPSYPYILAFFYVFFCFTFIFPMSNENKDLFYSLSMPTRKKDIVNARIFVTLFFEIGSLLFAIPFALLSHTFYPNGNSVGLDANLSLFAVALIGYSIFNLIFLPWYFKTGNKFLVPFLVSLVITTIIIFTLSMVLVYALPTYETMFDGFSSSTFADRLISIFVGLALLIVSTFATSYLSIKNFKKVDL